MQATQNNARAPRARWSAARAANIVHRAVGLWFLVLLTLVMGTGTLAVYAPELDRLVFPVLRASPPGPQAARVNPGLLYDNLLRAYPGMGVAHIETAPHEPHAAATTHILLPGGAKRAVALDPYTGAVLGEIPALTVRHVLSRAHAVLFQGLIGFYVVNFSGVLLLAAVVSGLFAYRRFWRSFFTPPRLGRGVRILLGDLHRLVALWCLPFLLVIALTGTWYFYNFPLAQFDLVPDVVASQAAPPRLSEADLDALGPQTPRRASGESVVDAVRAAYPDMTILGLVPPLNANMPFVVYGDRGEYLKGRNPNAVYVHPFTARIMGADLAEDAPLARYAFEAMSQLHHGELLPRSWGPLAAAVMKFLWFLFGVGACFLTVSGLLIHLRRARPARAGLGRRVWNWVKPWGGPMGVFKYVNVLVVVALAAGLVRVASGGPGPVRAASPGVELAARSAGGFDIVPVIMAPPRAGGADGPGPLRPGARVMVFPRIADGRFDEARAVVVGVTGAAGSSARGVQAKGAANTAFAPLALPGDLAGAELWVEVRTWDGGAHRARWPLGAPGAAGPPQATTSTARSEQ
jgi:uncharacterized iron-regulated membrane protein